MNVICLIGEIENESSCSSNFASYVQSFHDNGTISKFKVFTNALYDDYFYNEQPILFPNVYKGVLHGIINLLFEECIDGSDLSGFDLNDDTLSCCCKKSNSSSSKIDNDNDDDVAFCELDDEAFDEVIFVDQPILCNDLYGEHFDKVFNPLFGCEDSVEHVEVFSNLFVDDICEYKTNCHSHVSRLHKRIHMLMVCVNFFIKLSIRPSLFNLVACMSFVMKKNFSLILILMSMLVCTFIVSIMSELCLGCICTMKVKM